MATQSFGALPGRSKRILRSQSLSSLGGKRYVFFSGLKQCIRLLLNASQIKGIIVMIGQIDFINIAICGRFSVLDQ